MGTRLYDDFMKKLKVATVKRNLKKDEANGGGGGTNDEMVIAIPLKGGQGVSGGKYHHTFNGL